MLINIEIIFFSNTSVEESAPSTRAVRRVSDRIERVCRSEHTTALLTLRSARLGGLDRPGEVLDGERAMLPADVVPTPCLVVLLVQQAGPVILHLLGEQGAGTLDLFVLRVEAMVLVLLRAVNRPGVADRQQIVAVAHERLRGPVCRSPLVLRLDEGLLERLEFVLGNTFSFRGEALFHVHDRIHGGIHDRATNTDKLVAAGFRKLSEGEHIYHT